MKAVSLINEIQKFISDEKLKGKKIGFIPTMGTLHEGHLMLVHKAKEECDVVVVSIFVNPTQFNDKEDFKKYPRQEREDIRQLEEIGCNYVFLPIEEEIYPKNLPKKSINLGRLDEVMEGKFRPGHFEGVVNVVSRLFDIIQPDTAYFGRKDFQQVAVIKALVKQLNYSVQIREVDIVRAPSGLALSSRNNRLSEQEKTEAVIISKTLLKGKKWASAHTPKEVEKKMKSEFSNSTLRIEYIEIVHPDTLERLDTTWVAGATACISAYCGNVRLIDNLELII